MVLSGMEFAGLGLQGLGTIFGSSASKKAQKQMMKFFQQGLAQLQESGAKADARTGQALAANKAAQAALKAQTQRANRESLASQSRAETLAKRAAKSAGSVGQATAFQRGQAGTTIGMAARQAAARNIGQAAGAAAAQGGQQRQGLAMQLGSGLANLNQAQGSMLMQAGQQELQRGQALANFLGQAPVQLDTGLAQSLGAMGGQLFGFGAADRLGIFGGSAPQTGFAMPGGAMGQTLFGPGFGNTAPFAPPTAANFGFSPFMFGGY